MSLDVFNITVYITGDICCRECEFNVVPAVAVGRGLMRGGRGGYTQKTNEGLLK